MQIIGREKEQHELKRLYESSQSEFVAIYGRRRVGKTFLVKEFFNNKFTFYTTGLARGKKADQLGHFYASLLEYGLKEANTAPSCWKDAFQLLRQLIEQDYNKSNRKVIFLDEVPWMDTKKSDFIQAIDLFWNGWLSERNDVMLIVCGSAASWMVKNIIRNKGGLHNRLTCKLRINPFNLQETRLYLQTLGIRWNNLSIAECYMIMGGIPYYLRLLDKSLSLAQNIDRLFFNDNALLEDEFSNLYNSLFTHSDDYIKIISSLAEKGTSQTRNQLITNCKFTNGGSVTRLLEELEQCGFIRKTQALGESKKQIYQLIDFYSLFYFQFIKKHNHSDADTWMHIQNKHSYSNWIGYGFEHLCFAHTEQIRKALGISGISTRTYTLQTDTAQIDMLIDRDDRSVTVCEIKWTENEQYALKKSEMDKIVNRLNVAKSLFRTKNIMLCMITTSGLKENDYATEYVNNTVVLEDLFS